MNTIDIIRNLVREVMGMDEKVVLDDESLLQEEYSISSIAIIQLILKLEEVFSIEFSEDELLLDNVKNIISLNDTVNRLREKSRYDKL